MEQYKKDFIEFMVRCDVLTFGDFVTKSGRKTPFFINTGRYSTGSQLYHLCHFYRQAIERDLGSDFEVLFGPAYKGIPLASGVASAFAEHGREVGFCFNRKEVKDHGEGGSLVGHTLRDSDRVLIVEDVTTAGTSIRETVPILRSAAQVSLAGLIVSVDRQERGTGQNTALEELQEAFDMPTCSIVSLDEIVEHLANREIDGRVVIDPETLDRIAAYRAQYGA